jgi:hypothetical protein
MSKKLIQVSRNFLNSASKYLKRKVKPTDTTATEKATREYSPVDLVIVKNAQVERSSTSENGFGCSRIVVGSPTSAAPVKSTWRAMRFNIHEFLDVETDKTVPDGVLMIFTPEGTFYVPSKLAATN